MMQMEPFLEAFMTSIWFWLLPNNVVVHGHLLGWPRLVAHMAYGFWQHSALHLFSCPDVSVICTLLVAFKGWSSPWRLPHLKCFVVVVVE